MRWRAAAAIAVWRIFGYVLKENDSMRRMMLARVTLRIAKKTTPT